MKYVCDCCGKQLPIERGFDDDAFFDLKLQQHLDRDCPKRFEESAPTERSFTTASAEN